jgi:hypothetical protein
MTHLFVSLITLVAIALAAPAPQQPQSHARASETALDRYVAAPDASFSWKVLSELPAEGATVTLIEMT